MSTTASYFEKNAAQFDPFGREGSKAFRNCQLGAYWASWAHFTASTEPALLSLPTAAGKTGIMMALAFGLRARRVLVVTPARLLRDQTAGEFAHMDLLKSIGVLNKRVASPRVYSNEHVLRRKKDWNDLSSYDVVVATPRTTSPGQSSVCAPPIGLFDLVFLDEAHHAPARTWAAIIRAFDTARCVLLTATPFREDKRRLGARLIYHYPIARALRDGIYRPVTYHPVSATSNRASRDAALCEEAMKIFKGEKKLGHHPRILARAGDVAWSNRLISLYAKHGLRMGAVDYEKSESENKATVDAVRMGRLDGMLCVGMLGEGVDLPALKIAVLHSAPRSLPFTLQFIGRVSRTGGARLGEAHLLSVPEEVVGEMRRLHRTDADWSDLVPKLAEEILGKSSDLRHFYSGSRSDELDVNPALLNPFFSVRVYRTANKRICVPHGGLVAPEDSEICLADIDVLVDGLLVITERELAPPWALNSGIVQPRYDLHVFLLRGGYLFESTTWNSGADAIRENLVSGTESLIGGSILMRALHSAGVATYFNIGLRNATASNTAQPAYKTLMGSDVEAAVRPTEGQTYAPGHALARIGGAETRGIATGNGRVWAIKRADVNQFADWCDEVAKSLANAPRTEGLPQLAFLASASTIASLDERPLAAYLHDDTLRSKVTISATVAADVTVGDLLPYIEIVNLNAGTLTCAFEYDSRQPGVPVTYNPTDDRSWNQKGGPQLQVSLEFPNGRTFHGDLASYLAEYPPRLVIPSGGTLINKDLWRPTFARGPLPVSVLTEEKWVGCNTRLEVGIPKKSLLSIQDWLEQKLGAISSSEAIIVKDHGKGELADFIIVDPNSRRREIILYHCKAAGKGKRMSDRVKDVEEVLSQACRSAQWIGRPKLLQMISSQTMAPRRSPIVKGSQKKLMQLANSFEANTWNYTIVAVQPGVECAKAQSSSKIGFLLTAAYELVSQTNASFRFWGS